MNHCLARNSDPITSHAAADSMRGISEAQRARIVKTLESSGPLGLSSADCSNSHPGSFMIVNKSFIEAAYCEAMSSMSHEDAVKHVAATTGQDPETVEAVLTEEVGA